MDIKTEIVTLAIRVLSEKTGLIRQPDPLERLFSDLFGTKTREQRLAEDVIASSEQLVGAAKKLRTRHQFKKIVKNGM